ncbi:DUF2752 domain-containing protein [Mycobacterium sp. 141]|uniref:DUF2752 domain-containing protein n=1 Tax=Mycobacterium sp. 141 TaxID=1120797 RepID=UPI0003679467|nr:DUF2752 domain-containing protein [Mycobacterium sp. 141]
MGPSSGPGIRTTRYGALGAGVVLSGAVAYIGVADPHRPGFLFPTCPFKLITGWNCPACGGLRMMHDVLHADLGAAVVDNAFALVGLPVLAAWILVRWRLGKPLFPVPAIVTILIAAVIWTMVRNLPGFPLVPTFVDG